MVGLTLALAAAVVSGSWSTTTGELLCEAHLHWLHRLTLLRCTRPGCFWYEPVDLLRKLALTSLLQFVERGSVMQVRAQTCCQSPDTWPFHCRHVLQVLCGTSLAVASFGMQLRLVPYRQPEANLLKVVRE